MFNTHLEIGRTLPLMGSVIILTIMLMYKSSFSPLSVRLLGARGVWHGTMVTVIGVHLIVARRRTFGVPTLYMGITMA